MLRIALMGDLHFPKMDAGNRELAAAKNRFFSEYFKAFFETAADFHLSIGDLTHHGLEEEFREVYEYIPNEKVAFRQVLGNHDVLAAEKNKLRTILGQPLYDVVETEDALLIFLDTTKEMQLHGWGLDQAQWQWFSAQIERSVHKPLLVYAHHPAANTTTSSPAHDAKFEVFQDIRPILQKRTGPSFYFNGHTHAHSIVQQKNWSFIQTSAVICHPSICYIELDQHEIRIKTVSVENEVLLKGKKVLLEKLPDFHRPRNPMGKLTDFHLTKSLE